MPVDHRAELQAIATALDLRCTDANSGRCELCGRSARVHLSDCPIGCLSALLTEAEAPSPAPTLDLDSLALECAKAVERATWQRAFAGGDVQIRAVRQCAVEEVLRERLGDALLMPRAEVEAVKSALKQIVALEAPGDALDGLHALDVAETAARFAASALALLDRGDQTPAPAQPPYDPHACRAGGAHDLAPNNECRSCGADMDYRGDRE